VRNKCCGRAAGDGDCLGSEAVLCDRGRVLIRTKSLNIPKRSVSSHPFRDRCFTPQQSSSITKLYVKNEDKGDYK